MNRKVSLSRFDFWEKGFYSDVSTKAYCCIELSETYAFVFKEKFYLDFWRNQLYLNDFDKQREKF